jgi:hypothetical protein
MKEEREKQSAISSESHLQHPHGQVQGRQGRHQGVQKLDHQKYQTTKSGFPKSSQHLYSRELICQTISGSTVVKFRRTRSLPARLSFSTLLPSRATNAWAVGASTDDVSTLSSLGGVVQIVGSVANALASRMVRTS